MKLDNEPNIPTELRGFVRTRSKKQKEIDPL